MPRIFNAYEKAVIKANAKAVQHYLDKNKKLDEKIAALVAEKEQNLACIEQFAQPVRDMTGYEPLELCIKVPRGESQNDWKFRFPETIVPVENDAEVVEQNEQEEETTLREPSPVPVPVDDESNLPLAVLDEEQQPQGIVEDPMNDLFND